MKTANLTFFVSFLIISLFGNASLAQGLDEMPKTQDHEEIQKWIDAHLDAPELSSHATEVVYQRLIGARRQLFDNNTQTWMDDDSTLYEYVKDREFDVITQRIWDGMSWNVISQQLFQYNADGKIESRVSQAYDSLGWNNTSQTLWAYDSITGLNSAYIVQYWENGAWENDFRIFYFWSPDSFQTYSLYVIDSDTTTNNPDYKYLYTPTANKERETSVVQNGNYAADSWENIEKTSFFYNPGNGMVDSSRYQKWTGMTWTNATLRCNSYNAEDLLTMILSKSWDSTSTTWKNSWRQQISYQQNNTEIIYTSQSFNDSVWTNQSGRVEIFSPSNLILSRTFIFWNGAAWENNFRFLFEYEDHEDPVLIYTQLWDKQDSMFVYNDRRFYYYEPFSFTQIESIDNSVSHKVYPNPFQNTVHISFENPLNNPVKLEIYNLSGQLITVKQGSINQEEFVWDGKDSRGFELPGGIYSYRLVIGDKVGAGKIMMAR